jgi:hypothetical protein
MVPKEQLVVNLAKTKLDSNKTELNWPQENHRT